MQQTILDVDSSLVDSVSGSYTINLAPQDTIMVSGDTAVIDSTLNVTKPTKIESIFKEHQLQVNQPTYDKNPGGNEDWIAIHFLVGLIVFAWIRLFYAKRLKQVYKSLFGIRFQGMLEREGNLFKERISIALMIIYLISTSLLLYLLFTRIYPLDLFGLKSFKFFSLIMLAVIVGWIIKNLLNAFVGLVFKNPVVYLQYPLTNFIFNITIGSILFPVLVIAVYMPSIEMVYVALGIWAIAFIYRIIRLAVLSLSFTKFSLFNRFLYLCTFEFTPILVLIKLVMSYLD